MFLSYRMSLTGGALDKTSSRSPLEHFTSGIWTNDRLMPLPVPSSTMQPPHAENTSSGYFITNGSRLQPCFTTATSLTPHFATIVELMKTKITFCFATPWQLLC